MRADGQTFLISGRNNFIRLNLMYFNKYVTKFHTSLWIYFNSLRKILILEHVLTKIN